MTLGMVVMVGIATLLIISAIENASLVNTFLVVWKGDPISTLTPTTTSTPTTKAA